MKTILSYAIKSRCILVDYRATDPENKRYQMAGDTKQYVGAVVVSPVFFLAEKRRKTDE